MSSAVGIKLGSNPKSKGAEGLDQRNMALIVAALVAAGCTWHWSLVQRNTRTVEIIVAEYRFVAGVSLLIVALLYRFRGSIYSRDLGYRLNGFPKAHGWLLDGPFAIGMFGCIWVLGMRQFGGYDHSAMIEAAWVQFSSLVPFKDYPSTLPPLFIFGSRYALLFFGVRWSAFVLQMAVFAVLSFFFLSGQLRSLGIPPVGATMLALVAEVGTTVVCSFWWYNPVTSIVVAMVFVSTLSCLTHGREFRAWVLLGISFTLLVLSKPNAWPAGACVALLYATRDAGPRMKALAVLILGVALSGIICWIEGLNPIGVLRTYSAITETRGNPWTLMGLKDFPPVERTIMLRSTAVIAFLFLAVLISNRDELQQYWREYSCCVITACTSLIMASTNYELKTSDLMPLVVALAVASFRPWSKRRLGGFGRAATVMLIALFVTLSCYWGVTRLRARGIGEGVFFENVKTETIPTGFFAGLHSGPRLIIVTRQVEEALDKYPSKRVFFGPRMEFSYAAFRRDPPAGLPLWWHPGSSFSTRDLSAVCAAFEKDDFDLMVFLKNDRTRMPLVILRRKLNSYVQVAGFSELDVYVRRKGA